MDPKSTLGGILLVWVVTLAGCAANGAMVDPLIWWDKEDPADLAKYGPTPVQRIESLKQLAANAPRLSPQERASQAQQLSTRLPNEPNEVIRVQMVRTLGRLQDPSAEAGLKSALFDPEADVRRAAVVALGTLKSPEAAQLLGDALIRDRDYDVRLAAATALGELGTKEANEALVPALDDRDPAMRFAAIESLRKSSAVDYRGDTAKWREFAQGGNPQPPQTSIAEQLLPPFWR